MTTTMDNVGLEVFRRYAGLSLPRHVSYPMPTWWQDIDAAEAALMHKQSRREDEVNDLSLYVHVPFCGHTCRFCACTRIALPKDSEKTIRKVDAYVEALERELAWLAEAAGPERCLQQIHWGGGSPLYLSADRMESIQRTIQGLFTIPPDAEIAIEVDPRNATHDRLDHLSELGFNRISLGVQDFDEQVQHHVRRIQPFEMVRDTVVACRDLGFTSVNFDLIYGLPYQSVDTVRDTVERTIALSPDRIAYYHYAQIPEKIATQRGMDYTKLPDSETKLEMFLTGVSLFEAAGYEFVGLDHFAKPGERLAKASRDGSLQRNFQGMTTGGGLDLLGVGASSISHLLGIGFLQNRREVDAYTDCIRKGDTPMHRGKRFTSDDLVRQAVLNQLYCSAEIDPVVIEKRFDIEFADYFARELKTLEELERDGLVILDSDGRMRVTSPLGRVLMRNVAAVFDAYLDPDAYRVGEQACFSANA
jgi:oxygen-independent coproporphyrinogen-3 oxidase